MQESSLVDASMVTPNAWEIAAAIVIWVAGMTGILFTTAPEETRALLRRSTRLRRHRAPRRSFSVSGGDVVDSRHIRYAPASASRRDLLVQLKRAVGLESDRARESAGVGRFWRDRLGGSMTPANAPQQPIDPLAQQAATLLAKAMVTSHD